MLDAAIFEGAAALRRQLHRIPEIAGNEFKTQAAIREYISDLPLEVLPPFLETDTVAPPTRIQLPRHLYICTHWVSTPIWLDIGN